VNGDHEVSLLDHIVVSSGLAELITEVNIHHDWRGTCVEDGGFWSDHWPVSVTFDTGMPPSATDDAGGDGDTHGGDADGGDDEWIAAAEDTEAQCELCAELDCSGPSSASSPQVRTYL
jgi:hypothetical protein